MGVVEVRCPAGRMFVRLLQSGERPRVVEGNLMEFACPDCRRALNRQVAQVLHRYDLAGGLVETVTVSFDGSTEVRAEVPDDSPG